MDLITAWWDRAGHNTPEEVVPQRQRALLDLAEQGVRKLGKNIRSRRLTDATIIQIAALKADLLVCTQDSGASYSFTHDIFFEWVFFRHLVALDDQWTTAVVQAGEPPLLGRVIGLLAQDSLTVQGKWSAGYRKLASQTLRSQWRREWLTAAPFTPSFTDHTKEFYDLLKENDYALFRKVLVWFQAQHTVPSPLVLQTSATLKGNFDGRSIAEMLSWPSDFASWERLLDWLLVLAPTLPTYLYPEILEMFAIWQNVFASFPNGQSAAIIDICNDWLIELEKNQWPEDDKDRGTAAIRSNRWQSLRGEAWSRFISTLRLLLVRSVISYPNPAISLFVRATKNKELRRNAYEDLMGFAPIIVDFAPEAIVEVTKAELIKELPQEKLDREEAAYQRHLEYKQQVRAIPENERTPQQKRALEHIFSPDSHDNLISEDFGIDRFHRFYYPPSALHEPFASLFLKQSDAALSLVKNLAHHATTGWCQIQKINREIRGTPIAVLLDFPWGQQTFWGDWTVYSWFVGEMAPQPFECAFLALSYWAFKQIDAGRPVDEVIQALVQGSDCIAVLGLALVIALEMFRVSETTLPLVTCQRLWVYDTSRALQEPTRNLDPLDLGLNSRLTGAKAEAKAFLDARVSRGRDVRELAMRFVINDNEKLRQAFRDALSRFPADLPFESEEQRSNEAAQITLQEQAEQWAEISDINNYRRQRVSAEEAVISYEPSKPLTEEQKRASSKSLSYLQERSVAAWAYRCFEANKLVDDGNLDSVIRFSKERDNSTLFAQRRDVGHHAAQSCVSATAALVVRFGPTSGPDREWAWNVMSRVFDMEEAKNTFPSSNIPWHPTKHLIVSLVHDRRSHHPREETVQWLLELTAHPMEDVSKWAFQGLFVDRCDDVRWIAAQLAVDLSICHRAKIGRSGDSNHTADTLARKKSLALAIYRLKKFERKPFTDLPEPWVKSSDKHRNNWEEQRLWRDSDPFFYPHLAARLFPLFPIEAWCQTPKSKPLVERLLKQLVHWTAERLMPSWCDDQTRLKRDYRASDMYQWNSVLGDLIARAASFFDEERVRKSFLAPFLSKDESGLDVLAPFVEMTVVRHVFDAPTIPTNTLALLAACADRVVSDSVFNLAGYRPGELHGRALPKLLDSLLLITNDNQAPGAARFANGDWSQIQLVIPLISTLITKIGWSVEVTLRFLKLCERVGTSYPVGPFTDQVNAVIESLITANTTWIGTVLPSRIAAIVQRLADANTPLAAEQAHGLLRVLDALIDFGDRRSAALEQTECFKGIQMPQDLRPV